jgi:tRNA pseudouridine38-40 synthase
LEHFNNLIKIVLVIEYSGKRYFGYQWQPNRPTIQDELEKAVNRLTNESRRIVAACRTDTGVHAVGQVVSFYTESVLSPAVFIAGLNHYLPDDIVVKQAGHAPHSFNVMKHAVRREYIYKILNRNSRPALLNDFYCFVRYKLDTGLMDKAAKLLVGEHDFASFVTDLSREQSTVRNIYEAEVERKDDEVTFHVAANSFLTHQVRNIVGTLIRVGTGKTGLDEFKNILESKKLSLAGPTAPAQGLYLMKVIYPENSEFKYENLCT